MFKVERGEAGEKVAYVRMFSGAVRVRQRVDLPDGRTGKVMGVETFRDGRWARAAGAHAGQVAQVARARRGPRRRRVRRLDRAEAHHFPPPTLEASVEARDPAQQDPRSARRWPSSPTRIPLIAARVDQDGRATVSLYGRVQQEVIASTLAEEHGIEVEFSEASVLHVERLRRTGSAVERFNTPTNPYGATIGLRLSPAAPGTGVVFDLDVPLRDLPLYPVQDRRALLAAS